MWEVLKNALASVREALGIEIPELPGDLGTLTESATTAVQDVAESTTAAVSELAAEVVDGSTTITDAITGLPLNSTQPK